MWCISVWLFLFVFDAKGSSVPIEAKSSNEEDGQQHKDNELTPGQSDPTVNDSVKIPVLNDRGDVELKPQQGSALNTNKNNNSINNNQPVEEDKNKKAQMAYSYVYCI